MARVIKERCIKRRDAIKETKPTELSVSKAFGEFVDNKELTGRAAATIENYRQSLGYFMEFNKFDYDMPCNNIKYADIEEWVMGLQSDEDGDGNYIKPATTASINHYLRDLRTFLYWCMNEERGYISKPFKVELITEETQAPKSYTDEEIAALIKKPRKRDGFIEWRTWAVVNWILATGNRTGTVLNIKVKDIDFATGQVALTHTKNKKGQTTFISKALNDVLMDYLQGLTKKDGSIGLDAEDYLFPDVSLEQLTGNAMRHSYQKYCHNRGVEKTSLHGLRHTFAKKFIQDGGKLAQLQKILGHSTPAQTLHYAKFFDNEIKEDIIKKNPLDNFKKGKTREKKITKKVAR